MTDLGGALTEMRRTDGTAGRASACKQSNELKWLQQRKVCRVGHWRTPPPPWASIVRNLNDRVRLEFLTGPQEAVMPAWVFSIPNSDR
jgi:hypothetical protein